MVSCSEYLDDYTKNTMLKAYLGTLRSENTREVYTNCINMICDHFEKDFILIDEKDANAFWEIHKSRVARGEITSKTANMRFSTYSSFATYIMDVFPGYMDTNPYSRIIKPVFDSHTSGQYIPSLEEIDRLLSAAIDDVQFSIILRLVVRTGLSASEVLDLKKRDCVCKEDGTILLDIKGSDAALNDKARYVPLSSDIATQVKGYFDSVSSNPIFKNNYGNAMTVRNIDFLMKKYCKKAKLQYSYSIKDIRNRAILELSKNAPPNDVARYTGLSGLHIRRYVETAGKLVDNPAELTNFFLRNSSGIDVESYINGYIDALCEYSTFGADNIEEMSDEMANRLGVDVDYIQALIDKRLEN